MTTYRNAVRQTWSQYLRCLKFIPPEILSEIRPRLPKHYLRRLEEYENYEPQPVHWERNENKFYFNKHGIRHLVTNKPIDHFTVNEADDALWGGEGYVKGFTKEKYNSQRVPHIWKPWILRKILYSEILNRHMSIQVTLRTMEKIDDNLGLDFYILRTHLKDLGSKLGGTLKREMTLALSIPDLWPNDETRRLEVLDKYREFIMPVDEAEWLCLPLEEAVIKQLELDEQRRICLPRSITYERELLIAEKERRQSEPRQIESGDDLTESSSSSSWLPTVFRRRDRSSS